MKKHPAKASRSAEFLLSKEESRITVDALDFMMFFDDHTSGDSNIFSVDSAFSHDNAFNAVEKIDAGIFSFSRRELRAIIGAIEYSLQHMNDSSNISAHVDEDFPGIIASLKESVPILESLKIRLSAVVAKLARQK